MPQDEQRLFLEDMNLKEPAIQRFITECFTALERIHFFTIAGGKEAHAWEIPKHCSAFDAAGTIHSDMQQGFIRAEVVTYDDLIKNGSIPACREKGLFRLEGKEYIVNDGDILNVRFNV